jgi:excisionase family DNA binding protein
MTEVSQWLTLTEAARLLGVHPATLREWADAGQVPSFRTPGGHRRFRSADLRAFLLRAGSGQADIQTMLDTAVRLENVLVQTRQELRRLPTDEASWYQAFDEPGRERQRALGRQLFAFALQFVTQPEQGPELLARARQLGRAYAESSLHYGISLLQTVRAFQYFRENLLRALVNSETATATSPQADAQLRQGIDAFLNEVLYGLIAAYEQELMQTATSEAVAVSEAKA